MSALKFVRRNAHRIVSKPARMPSRRAGLISLGAAACLGALAAWLWKAPERNPTTLHTPDFARVRRAVAVFAHADDEVLAAGLLTQMARNGTRVTLVALTDGRANRASLADRCEESDMFACRTRELKAAADILGVDDVVTPGLPDGSLAAHAHEGVSAVRAVVARVRPDAIVSVEASGLNGHRDHRAAHAIARDAVRAEGLLDVTIYFATLPHPVDWVLRSRMPDALKGSQRVLELSEEDIARKVGAARAHASQQRTIDALSLGLGPERLFRWMDREAYFVGTLREWDAVLGDP